MKPIPIQNACKLLFVTLVFFLFSTVHAGTRGIYITQSTAENTSRLNHLISQSKAVGINTFIIDLTRAGPTYIKNVKRVKAAGIRFVARIVVFPLGGTPAQVKSKAYWEKKNRLAQKAIDLGADEIQLDYIRYNTKQRASSQNSKDVLEVIKYFKSKVEPRGAKLQVAVFGETSFYPSKRIGQDITLYGGVIDVLCPMLYPSHFEPFRQHAKTPYKTVFSSLEAIKSQYNQKVPFRVNAYIELFNYRYKMSWAQRIEYINAQIKATKDAGIDGWYAWSANNHYKILFEVLGAQSQKVSN